MDGSQQTAFEELCCQLAALEPSETGSHFLRKGRGADGGVECLRRRGDGSEAGWQAKYVFKWSSSLASQLDESIETALRAHPRLVTFTVCVPFDLPDSRVGARTSARRKWHEWKQHWEDAAAADGRQLSIVLWGQSELLNRLTADSDRSAGRLLYWFDSFVFSKEFFQSNFETARATLGSRYTRETNITLPIRKDFLALTRDGSLQRDVDRWFLRVGDAASKAIDGLERLDTKEASNYAAKLRVASDTLTSALGATPVQPGDRYPLDSWRHITQECEQIALAVHRWIYSTDAKRMAGKRSGDSSATSAIHYMRQLLDAISEVHDALNGRRWELANRSSVLLTGEAGSGKSHLLADVVQHQIDAGLPALLIPAGGLNDSEPWRQILTELDRPATEQVRHFLGALDAAAEALQSRALICIDAINERHGTRIWPQRLSAFLKMAEPYPHVVVVLSCRTTYLPYVVPSDLTDDRLFRINHEGFADDQSGTAAQRYLDERGIVRPGAPSLLPEFNNPLFLKTCCDLLQRQGVFEFPRGMQGVSAIFEFYFGAITRAINERLGLDPSYEYVPRAIEAFVDLLASRGGDYVDKTTAIAVFEGVRPSGGTLRESLLSQLLADGLLSIEPVVGSAGALVEHVRFTFERYSDYAIAKRALDRWLDPTDVRASFSAKTPLGTLAFSANNYERAGILEALAVQLPERTGWELIELGSGDDWTLVDAFRDSLLWRNQEHFSEKTYSILGAIFDADIVNDVLISVSGEPKNSFNARFLDSSLRKLSMRDRDSTWSIYLARKGFSEEVETLVSWALTSGARHVEEERAELTATTLTWLLTTSHREVRDKATKALAALLSTRLELAAKLIARFRDINDIYVLERLLAACYGAALQGSSRGLDTLAEHVYEHIFARDVVVPDVLLRDHALGIVEYAAHRKMLPSTVEIGVCRPPYKSPWPIEYVPDQVIESFVQHYPSGTFTDAIVSSVVNDGDFARYKMDRRVDDWSSALISETALPTVEDVYVSWESSFLAEATDAQKAAFSHLLSTADCVRSLPEYQHGKEIEQWNAAKEAFRESISADAWEAFRVQAERYIRFYRYNEWLLQRPATFNTSWARRWVCKRAHDLGWEPAQFADFERTHIAYGRTEHRIERIGKKYQWIAFRELLARMSDNLSYIGSYRSGDSSRAGRYSSARQVDVRDIDPSLLVSSTHYDSWAEWPSTWWSPVQPKLRAVTPQDRLAWLYSNDDVLTGSHLIDVADPKSQRRWLVLSAFAHWRGSGLSNGERELQRSTWYRVNCVVVPKPAIRALRRSVERKTLVDPDAFERIELGGDFYLGECLWHPELQEPSARSNRGPRTVGLRSAKATTVRYSCEAGGFDYSIDKTISLEIPAPWLASALGLRLFSGRQLTFVDDAGEVIFFDPSVIQPGPSAALVDREAFLSMLEGKGLAAFWVVAGEKDISRGGSHRQKPGGRYSHTTAFWLDSEWNASSTHEEWYRPSADQLADFLSEPARKK